MRIAMCRRTARQPARVDEIARRRPQLSGRSLSGGNRVVRVDRLGRSTCAPSMRNGPPGCAGDGECADGTGGTSAPNKVLAADQGSASIRLSSMTAATFSRSAASDVAGSTMLDPGPFGCIGVGVPYGIAASLAFPIGPVVVATGDGAFGFNAIEIDTAVRHKAPVVIVVANNGAWQIEVHDQTVTHGKVVGTRLQFADHAAMARAFGMHGERVETEESWPGARSRVCQPPGAARRGRHARGDLFGR